MKNWDIEDCIIIETLVGSQLYGTSTPDSDTDLRGVCIPPWHVRNNPVENFEQKDSWDGKYEDRVIYNLKKFLKLCADANPAIIEILFVPERFWVKPTGIIRQSHPWMQVLEKRGLFISKKARYTFTGYAHSQLQKIKTHRQWLLNPPKAKPTREGYGLPLNPIISYEQMSALLTLPEGLVLEQYREEARLEKSYRDAKRDWDMYDNWKGMRNKGRAELEAKFGYDTKHASHLVRLMQEGKELLLSGKITLPRPEAEELIAIRNGKYSYDELLSEVENFDSDFERFYEESPLPHSADINGIVELYLNILSTNYSGFQYRKMEPSFAV